MYNDGIVNIPIVDLFLKYHHSQLILMTCVLLLGLVLLLPTRLYGQLAKYFQERHENLCSKLYSNQFNIFSK